MGVAIVLFFVGAAILLLILARYAKHPALLRQRAEENLSQRRGPPKGRIAPLRLQTIAGELLRSMGLVASASEPLESPGSVRIEAVGKGALRDSRHLIYLEPQPIGERVGPETVLQLAEDVRGTGATVGILISPFLIDRAAAAGLDVELELIDGLALRRLVRQHLPQLSEEMNRYHLTGSEVVSGPIGDMAPSPM